MKSFPIICLLLQLVFCLGTKAQSKIQGDTCYHKLQVEKSTLPDVEARMGKAYSRADVLGTRTSMLQGGVSVSSTYVAGYLLRYQPVDITFLFTKSNELQAVHFGPASGVVSAKGIRPGSSFAEVAAKYGAVDAAQKDGALPAIQELTPAGKSELTTLAYPGIRFASAGKKQPGENILLRKVEEIWLE